MTDAIVQWLLSAGEGKFLATVLISMLPVIRNFPSQIGRAHV